MPVRAPSLFMAWNIATMGRTLPGLQYSTSRTSSIGISRVGMSCTKRLSCRRVLQAIPINSSPPSLAVVLVMAAPPEPRLVPALGRAVEPLVHAPEAVHPALVRGVGVVHNPILQHERAHTGPFLPVRRPVCSNARSELGDEGIILARHGQSQIHRAEVVLDSSRLPLLLGVRHMEVVVESVAGRGRPGKRHPIRRLDACSFASGARRNRGSVTAGFPRWTTGPVKPAAEAGE